MEPTRPLAPCFIGSGTISHPRDMIRALETLESLEFVYELDGVVISSGDATLVKLMADPDSATMAVNGCLFLNVASFRYLDFETDEEGRCTVRLYGDGSLLALRTAPDAEGGVTTGQMRLIEEAEFSLSELVLAEDEDEDE
ncbi:MAG: hypothetical protein ACNA76_05035 [Anaerosomatales bacterium]|nr:hypothetical protein [Coriobacteriia bacterium]